MIDLNVLLDIVRINQKHTDEAAMLEEAIDEETFEPEIEEGLKRIDKQTDRKLMALCSFFTVGLIGSLVLSILSDDNSPWRVVGGAAALVFACAFLTLCDFGRNVDAQKKHNYFDQMRDLIREMRERTPEESQSLVVTA